MIVEKQREVSPWNVTPAGQPPDKVGNRTLPSPKAGCMGRGFAASQTGLEVIVLTITIETACRFILGKQGLWPGRRWRDSAGTEAAMRAMEYLQLDPLQIIARSQDIALHSRVLDYTPGMWEDLTYQQRKFFDWGGWLDELPHWRRVMRRERDGAYGDSRLRRMAREHTEAIEEMRDVLRERGTVSNRDFAMASRTRTQSYRGRKDSALALYYLWYTGDVMTHHRENFERVYALTETVAPAALIRESDEAEADRFLIKKDVSFSGLSRPSRFAATASRSVPHSSYWGRWWPRATSSRCRWRAGNRCITRSAATHGCCTR